METIAVAPSHPFTPLAAQHFQNGGDRLSPRGSSERQHGLHEFKCGWRRHRAVQLYAGAFGRRRSAGALRPHMGKSGHGHRDNRWRRGITLTKHSLRSRVHRSFINLRGPAKPYTLTIGLIPGVCRMLTSRERRVPEWLERQSRSSSASGRAVRGIAVSVEVHELHSQIQCNDSIPNVVFSVHLDRSSPQRTIAPTDPPLERRA